MKRKDRIIFRLRREGLECNHANEIATLVDGMCKFHTMRGVEWVVIEYFNHLMGLADGDMLLRPDKQENVK